MISFFILFMTKQKKRRLSWSPAAKGFLYIVCIEHSLRVVCALKHICRKPCFTTSFTFLLYGSILTSLNSNFLQSLQLCESLFSSCFKHPGISRASSATLCLVPQQRALTRTIRLSLYYSQYGMIW